jgi:hypothetical protein
VSENTSLGKAHTAGIQLANTGWIPVFDLNYLLSKQPKKTNHLPP